MEYALSSKKLVEKTSEKLAFYSFLFILVTPALVSANPVDDLQPGHWYEVPNSYLSEVYPNPLPEGSSGPSGIIDAWNGGAYDTKRDRLIVWGGGHLDYSGNEIYVFDTKALAWERLDDPSDPITRNPPDGRNPDGRPASRHTYNYIQYAPNVDRFFSLCFSAAYGDPSTDGREVDAYDFDLLSWEKKASKPFYSNPIGSISAYDPLTGLLWSHGASNTYLTSYDPINDSWTVYDSEQYLAYYTTAAIDPTRHIMVAVGGSQFYVWDLDNPDADPTTPVISGNNRLESAQAPGFVYDPVSDKFVGWNGGSSVYTLDPDTWVWTEVQASSSNTVTPTASNDRGTNGRFRYIPSKNAFIVVNSTTENVFIYKLSAGSGSTDIVTAGLENLTGNTVSNAVTTFGHAFKQGDVAADTVIGARLSDGADVPLQVIKKATYSDGSLRHGIITANIPVLTNAGDTLTLSTNGTEPEGNDVGITDILASNFDAQISLNVDGTIYSASARDLLQNTTAETWFSGPLASEYLVSGAVKTSGGDEHAHLTAYFHIRAYAGLSQVRVDVILENNWSFAPAPGNLNIGNATINIDGVDVFDESFTHYHHSRWHKQFWWGGETEVYVKHDHDYLQATKAIPKYEDLTPSDGFLNSVRQSILPMQKGDQQAYMPDPGFQPGIGPLPKWDAVYAISADRRAYHYMLANADAGGSYSVHYRDKNTTYPISIDDYPAATLADPVASAPSWPQVTGGNPYNAGSSASHQPSIGFLPYIVTGDYYYLEEAQFWTAYNLIWTNAAYRNYAAGWWYTGSLRGQAWAYRSLAQIAYITPDDHAMKAYFNAKLQSNIDRDIQRYVSPGGQYQNNLGAMYMVEGNEQYRFYDYFMSWVVQYMVDLGFDQALPFRDYKLQFPIGLMGVNAGEYCFQVSAQYTWEVGPVGTSVFFNDFNEVYTAMYPQLAGIQCGSQAMADALNVSLNEITAGQSSTSYYFANLQPALAAAADSGLPGGLDAWSRAHLSGIHPDYSDEPIWAVIPRLNPSIVAVNISADSLNIFAGESVTLSWSSANADTCTASGAWTGGKNINGTEVVSPNGDSIYTLECSGQTGTNSSSVTIIVIGDLVFKNGFDVTPQLLSENFSSYVVNSDALDWLDTGVNNSMQEDDSLFKVYDLGGNMAFGTSNVNSTNIHSHYIGAGSGAWSNYIYSGRMRIEGGNDNIGVTFYSDYPNTDRYYRLRRGGNSDFYIAPHGTNCTGDTQTGVTPTIGNWYEFLVDVRNLGNSTNIKAKVWRNGTAEPVAWQIDCSDSSTSRLLNGTVGVWGVVNGNDSGDKLWDNLKVVPAL